MPIRLRQLVVVLALAFSSGGLGGCANINGALVSATDYIPAWAGGLPADAPPRPGTAKYDAYMREREQQRLQPAPAKDAAGPSPSSADAIH